MTEKSKTLVMVGGFSVVLAIGTLVLSRRAGLENQVRTGGDILAGVIFIGLLVAMFPVGRLLRGDDRNMPAPKAFDLLLTLGLIAVTMLVATWSGHLLFVNIGLLVLIVFNLGRWRGLQAREAESDHSSTEVWSR